jgi:small-conductance mechanosensitive channel
MQIDLAALGDTATGYTAAAVLAAMAIVLGWLAHLASHVLLVRLARASVIKADEVIVRCLRLPARWTLITLALVLATRFDPLLGRIWSWLEPFVIPALLGWIAVSLVRAVALILEGRKVDGEDRLALNSRRTRITFFSRTAGFLIAFVTIALMLLAFPGVREIGVTLMASAGLVGLAVGAAAQPALKSLIAGVQMALTEPIRIDDYVVIEGESGRVEDIRMTYVVIRTGDNRRLIVPTTKFLDTTFQNWTRVADGLNGTVSLHLRHGTPVAPVRAAFEQLLASEPGLSLAPGKVTVAGFGDESYELQLAVSAKDPAALAKLRSAVREAMLEWLQRELPGALKA